MIRILSPAKVNLDQAPLLLWRKKKPEGEEDTGKQLQEAATACLNLERQCVGQEAPWQINISGDTADALEGSLLRLRAVIGTERESRELKALLEDVVRCMLMAKTEVYEALRKDSYPRFLVSEDCARLNGNETFKRLLAAEKWDQEVQRTTTTTSTSRQSVVDDHKKSLSYEVTLTAPGSNAWTKPTRTETLEPPSSSAERGSDGSRGDRPSLNSDGLIEIRVEPQPVDVTKLHGDAEE